MSHSHGTGLTEAETAETLRDPYAESPKYAWITCAVFGGLIALFALAHASYAVRRRYPLYFQSSGYLKRKTAAWRWLSLRQFKVTFRGQTHYLPVLGPMLIMLAVFLFLFTWTWAVRPYYYSHWYISSPPLAIRTGFMALACFPFIFAFASKVNVVTFVTGASHEKLQIYHQYLSHLFLFLSWVHTIPFLIQGLSEYKPDYDPPTLQLNYSMFVKRKVYYWTGVILLFQLSFLCWGSLPYFRRKNYEFFKWFHVANAIAFIGFLFHHCNKLLGSWDYLYATVVVYGACVLLRFIYLFLLNGAGLPKAKFEVLDGGMVRLRVLANGEEKWKPGQHYFLNFPSCQPFQSHPFTVASIPESSPHPHTRKELHLLIRQASGLTQKLYASLSARTTDTIPVLLDGPYGGLNGDLALYEHALLIAGGAGITFVMPILADLINQLQYKHTKISTIDLVWSVKETDHLRWAVEELQALQTKAPQGCVRLTLHVTRGGDNKQEKENPASDYVTSYDRADVADLVAKVAEGNSTVGIAACGPEGLTYDVRNAVAEVERRIMSNATNCKEMFLHTEEYSW